MGPVQRHHRRITVFGSSDPMVSDDDDLHRSGRCDPNRRSLCQVAATRVERRNADSTAVTYNGSVVGCFSFWADTRSEDVIWSGSSRGPRLGTKKRHRRPGAASRPLASRGIPEKLVAKTGRVWRRRTSEPLQPVARQLSPTQAVMPFNLPPDFVQGSPGWTEPRWGY